MTLHLYNSKTRKIEEFKPIHPEMVLMYVCGPTVYNHIHVGNARPAVVFDVLFKLLKRHFKQVKFARNITDIDDKIMAHAVAEETTIDKIATLYTQEYHKDLKELGVEPPTFEPKATDYIQSMVELVEQLLEKRYAYESEGHVLFDVNKMSDYGALSGRNINEMMAGERVEVASYKKFPLDFILWKPSSSEQPGWESPWGRGRPGWHLECSAMIHALLGTRIDIHGGGQDLQFPHHENERAQSCCASGEKEFANYWVHNGYITMSGEKMSKSLGNVFTVSELLQHYDGEVLRFVLLGTHYRKPLDWTENALQRAKSSLDGLYQVLLDHDHTHETEEHCDDYLLQVFEGYLLHDLNTPQAIAYLYELAVKIRQSNDKKQTAVLLVTLCTCAQRLGLLQKEAQEWFQQTLNTQQLDNDAIEALIIERKTAKARKDFVRSDEIRNELQKKGVILKDTLSGTVWQRQ